MGKSVKPMSLRAVTSLSVASCFTQLFRRRKTESPFKVELLYCVFFLLFLLFLFLFFICMLRFPYPRFDSDLVGYENQDM